MRYSYEFKLKCVELYRQSKWPDTPDGVKPQTFRHKIRAWARIEEINGPEALRPKATCKAWKPEEKFELVSRVISGSSITSAAISAGISDGLLSQWVRNYKTLGYNGLMNMRKVKLPKELSMKKKSLNYNNPRKLEESEYEELIRLRSENEYIKTEIEVIKKEIAFREEKEAVRLKAKKQRSSKNSENRDIN